MIFSKNDKLVMIGDSITDCGRARPIGEGLSEALGKGYAALVDAFLQSSYPHLGIRTVNMGISGNTVRDLASRWETDVLDLKPDWVSVLIGINDVWRQFDTPFMKETHVGLEEYESTLRELVRLTEPSVKGMILMAPFYMEPNQGDSMRATMDGYGEGVKRVAKERNAIFVDTQAAFDKLLKYKYSSALSWDRVHPSMVGHMAIARAFLKETGFSWDGDRTVENGDDRRLH